ATPVADPNHISERIVLKGELPSPMDPPAGCPFNPRCPKVFEKCYEDRPVLQNISDNVTVACHLFD
ncbi:MAG: oligopeptide/dipeptide ABC transporter ATP-binding protein, partial [Sneathiella sp.]